MFVALMFQSTPASRDAGDCRSGLRCPFHRCFNPLPRRVTRETWHVTDADINIVFQSTPASRDAGDQLCRDTDEPEDLFQSTPASRDAGDAHPA